MTNDLKDPSVWGNSLPLVVKLGEARYGGSGFKDFASTTDHVWA